MSFSKTALVLISSVITALGAPMLANAAPQGNGYPFTQIIEGQHGVEDCPAGYQGANGIISSGGKTYTECWPANAWEAWRIGGSAWEKFVASGGSYDPAAEKAAWDKYYADVDAAQKAAEDESKAWNAANPGKQKCVQWGPIVNPEGGESSGGVCANPVSLPSGSIGESDISSSPSVSISPSGSVGESDVSSTSSSASQAVSASPALIENATPIPSQTAAIQGNGYPFTYILSGQHGLGDCPAPYNAANGLIAAIGKGTFTECWPANAWAAYRIGGDTWQMFKATGGSYDLSIEIDRQAKVGLLRAKAKSVAEAAALETPGIERCSSWVGFGESGKECAYVFVAPKSVDTSSSSASVSPVIKQTSATFSATLSPNADTGATSSIAVAVESVKIAGSSLIVSDLAMKLTSNETEAASISSLADAITEVKTVQKSLLQSLPRDPTLDYKVVSLTPKVCLASTWRVRVSKPGLCQLSVEITDSEGNEYSILKKIRRKF